MSTLTSDNPFSGFRLNTDQDFQPEWDVPSFNEAVSTALVKAVRRVKCGPMPNPEHLIYVMRSEPGYGKTHLLGRLHHAIGNEVCFVFVPAFEDPSQPLRHIRWHMVESLFRSTAEKPSFLAMTLARLCHDSFVRYFADFPPSLAARYQALLHALQQNPAECLAIANGVKDLLPFQFLAQSVADSLPDLPHGVVRALALGWSPVANLARRWLRGEALPETDLATLQLPEDPPAAADVLRALSALLKHRVPIVVCVDQVESVLKFQDGPKLLTAGMMELLQSVPNLMPVLSFLEHDWQAFQGGGGGFTAFMQRVSRPALQLQSFKPEHAVEMIERRLKTWSASTPGRMGIEPFDEPSVLTLMRRRQPNPRIVLQQCAVEFARWHENDQQGLIYLTEDYGDDPPALFVQEWNRELEAIRQDSQCVPTNLPEERLYRAIYEALVIAREARRDVGGVVVKNIEQGTIKQAGKYKRYALRVSVAAGSENYAVLVPVTTVDSGTVFQFYFPAVLQALGANTSGALLVHAKSDFRMGRVTQDSYDKAVKEGKVRLFALEDNTAAFERLECLMRFIIKAEGKDMQFGRHILSVQDCQDYVIRTAALDNLDLFKVLGAWRKQPVRAATPALGKGASPPPKPQLPPTPPGPTPAPAPPQPPAALATRLVCPGCQAPLRIPGPVTPGTKLRCPKCQTVLALPPTGLVPTPVNAPTSPPPQPARAPAIPPAAGSQARMQPPSPAPASPPGSLSQPQPAPVATSQPPPQEQPAGQRAPDDSALVSWARDRLALLVKKLDLWGQPVTPVEGDNFEIGPTFARLKVLPKGSKTTYKKVADKAVDLKIHLGIDEPPLIGSQAGYISIDIQRPTRRTVTLREALADPPGAGAPTFPAGLDVAGQAHWLNLADTADCHLLVAGTTGSGKSEFLRAMVASLASRLSSEQVQFYFIDPKRVTFNFGVQKSPYLRAPVAYDTGAALPLVEECLAQTRSRFDLLQERKLSNVSELETPDLIPQIVLVIDEFANLMEDKDTKKALTALLRQIGSMSRAAGIHLVLATQRPDKDVVTPLLRDNLPGRIALKVASPANSNLILGCPDAAHLLGKGDLLWKRGGGLVRLQSPFVSQAELEAYLKIG